MVTPVKPNTIATSIAIGDPADGYDVIHTVRDTGGWGESATDAEIVDAIKLSPAPREYLLNRRAAPKWP